jgi:hypothetical protein
MRTFAHSLVLVVSGLALSCSDSPSGDGAATDEGSGGAAGALTGPDAAKGTGGASHGSGGTSHGSGGISQSTGGAGSGGSDSGISGSGGTTVLHDASIGDGAPPASCKNLGASGDWQAVPLPIPSGVSASLHGTGVAVDPARPGVVYVAPAAALTGYGLFRSDDCGATWTKPATGRNADAINSGSHYTFLFDSRNPDILITESFYGSGHLYRTTDRGVDWDNITPTVTGAPGFVQMAAMDPDNPDHLLMSFHENCTGAYAPVCLAETTDQGGSWRLVKGPSQVTGWGEGAGVVVISEKNWLYANPDGGLYTTIDAGATWTQVYGYPGCMPTMTRSGADMFLGCNNGCGTPCSSNRGVEHSTDGVTWKNVAAPNTVSPRATALIAVGARLYASSDADTSGRPVYTAPVSDPSRWTNLPASLPVGFNVFAYDATSHLLYAGAQSGTTNTSLYRVVLP